MARLGQTHPDDQGPRAGNRAERRHPDTAAPLAGDGVTRLTYSPSEAGKVLGISRGRVYQLLADGSLSAKRLRARTLVEHAELERFLASLPIRETAG